MHDPLKYNGQYPILIVIKQNKKIPVFRVTRPYLNLLVKPRIFFRFSGKNRILCILKGKMPFKMLKIVFYSRKKDKKMCVPTLPKIFRPVTPNKLIFFIWPNYIDIFGKLHYYTFKYTKA